MSTVPVLLQPAFLRRRLQFLRLSLRGQQIQGVRLSSNQLDSLSVPLHSPAKTLSKSHQFGLWLVRLFTGTAIAGALVVATILFVPEVYYRVFPVETVPIAAANEGSPLGGSFHRPSQEVPSEATPSAQPVPLYEPPIDANLPEGEWIVIPRIGVRTQLQPTQRSEEALATGVWMVPEYGRPGSRDVPLIAAAHRFGWSWWWKSDYWQYHSFYRLPELEPGDQIEIISGQRKWIYEIYAGEEGQEITDYEADLILYTCKFLNSPLRHFRYARIVDPTVNTQ